MGIGMGMLEETVSDVRTLLAHWVGQQGKDSSIDWKKNGWSAVSRRTQREPKQMRQGCLG